MRNTPYSAKILLFFSVVLICLPTYISMYRVHEGRLLVSTGSIIGKGIFTDTVIFLEVHRLGRAYGVIVNKKMAKSDIPDAVPTVLKKLNIPVYYGGPVEYPDHVFVLTTLKGKVSLKNLGSLAKDREAMLATLKSIKDEPDIKIMLGYAGWGPFQLNVELQRKRWGVIDTQTDLINDLPPGDIWKEALKRLLEEQPEKKGKIL